MSGEPVVERIAQAVATRLATVTTANGYQVELADVVRPLRRGDYVPQDSLCVLEQLSPFDAPDGDYLMGNEPARVWVQPFLITLYVQPDETDTTPVDTRVNLIRSEVERAVMAGDGTWGSLALGNTHLAGADYIDSADGSYSGVQITLEITYRVPQSDPYTVR